MKALPNCCAGQLAGLYQLRQMFVACIQSYSLALRLNIYFNNSIQINKHICYNFSKYLVRCFI